MRFKVLIFSCLFLFASAAQADSPRYKACSKFRLLLSKIATTSTRQPSIPGADPIDNSKELGVMTKELQAAGLGFATQEDLQAFDNNRAKLSQIASKYSSAMSKGDAKRLDLLLRKRGYYRIPDLKSAIFRSDLKVSEEDESEIAKASFENANFLFCDRFKISK